MLSTEPSNPPALVCPHGAGQAAIGTDAAKLRDSSAGLCTASKAVAPPLRGPDHPPRWQNVINAQRCRRRRHKPAEDGRTVTSCLIGAAEGRDFLMHARDRRMKVLNRRDATIKWLQGSGCSVKEPVFLLVFQR